MRRIFNIDDKSRIGHKSIDGIFLSKGDLIRFKDGREERVIDNANNFIKNWDFSLLNTFGRLNEYFETASIKQENNIEIRQYKLLGGKLVYKICEVLNPQNKFYKVLWDELNQERLTE